LADGPYLVNGAGRAQSPSSVYPCPSGLQTPPALAGRKTCYRCGCASGSPRPRFDGSWLPSALPPDVLGVCLPGSFAGLTSRPELDATCLTVLSWWIRTTTVLRALAGLEPVPSPVWGRGAAQRSTFRAGSGPTDLRVHAPSGVRSVACYQCVLRACGTEALHAGPAGFEPATGEWATPATGNTRLHLPSVRTCPMPTRVPPGASTRGVRGSRRTVTPQPGPVAVSGAGTPERRPRIGPTWPIPPLADRVLAHLPGESHPARP